MGGFWSFRPLKCRDVRKALERLGFKETGDQVGSHVKCEAIIDGKMRKVTLDCHRGEVRALDVKSIIAQSGVSKSAFFGAMK